MHKILLLSVIVAGVIAGGCATSNRDYSASSLVVDVTNPHSTVSAPTAAVKQYPAPCRSRTAAAADRHEL